MAYQKQIYPEKMHTPFSSRAGSGCKGNLQTAVQYKPFPPSSMRFQSNGTGLYYPACIQTFHYSGHRFLFHEGTWLQFNSCASQEHSRDRIIAVDSEELFIEDIPALNKKFPFVCWLVFGISIHNEKGA